MVFKDRIEAGRKLAEELREYARRNAVIYALPRGGAVVGAEIAKRLSMPLDLIITRKIGHPYSPEYAIAAVAENGDIVVNEEEIAGVDKSWLAKEIKEQKTEAKRRREAYLGASIPPKIKGKTAIIVDDGLATGLTMKAAIMELRHQQPKKIVIAVPVAAQEVLDDISKSADKIVCLYSPGDFFGSIGEYYESFGQVSDEEVVAIVQGSRKKDVSV